MRLINTDALSLHSFNDDSVPQYAILSHTWATDDSEVSLQEFTAQTNPDKRGWEKIRSCCRKARADGWDWAWIDTCCIDKTSSAELSEAINSMYRWYAGAGVCYAHLSDVDGSDESMLAAQLRRCRWFTRGWTLQELLAPAFVVFLDHRWREVGTRYSLESIVKEITGVHVFGPEVSWTAASVAQKFSWAARRKTTRVEDQAYCLLGLFGVHMPLLYGEGQNAFRRLQEEIMRTSNDESIFVWQPYDSSYRDHYGALAPSVYGYYRSNNVVPPSDEFSLWRNDRSDFAKTKEGVRIKTVLYEKRENGQAYYCAVLNCGRRSDGSDELENPCVAVFLIPDKDGAFVRPRSHKLLFDFVKPEEGSSKWLKTSDEYITINDRRQYSPFPVWGRREDNVLVALQIRLDVKVTFGQPVKINRGFTSYAYDAHTSEIVDRQWRDTKSKYPGLTWNEASGVMEVAAGWVITITLSFDGDIDSQYHSIALAVRERCLYMSALLKGADAVTTACHDSYCENLPDTLLLNQGPSGRVVEVKIRPKPSTGQGKLKEYYLCVSYRDASGSHDN